MVPQNMTHQKFLIVTWLIILILWFIFLYFTLAIPS